MPRNILLALLLLLGVTTATSTPASAAAPASAPVTSSATSSTVAVAAPAPNTGAPPIRKFNGMLVDMKGRGLYTWDGDVVAGRSSCNNQCRLLWPPIFADEGAQPRDPFDLVKRDDGRQQWALRGRPLYRWASDKKFGDAGGDGVSDTWHLVRFSTKPAATAPAAPPTKTVINAPAAKQEK